MKNLFIASLMLCMGTVICSCNDDDNSPSKDNMPQNCFVEFRRITGTTGYSMDEGEMWMLMHEPGAYDERSRKAHPEYYDSVRSSIKHRPMAYENMRIVFHSVVSMDEPSWTWSDEERKYMGKYYDLTVKNTEKLSLSNQQWNEINAKRAAEGKDLAQLATFFNARIAGNVVVTADKTLFAMPAGQDLSSHFLVQGPSTCLPQGPMTAPKCLFWHTDEVEPKATSEFFVPDTWLQRNYAFWLKDIPEEQYDELTFTVSLPVVRDNWVRYFADDSSQQTERQKTLTATITVRFKRMSDFEQQLELRSKESADLLWRS